MSRAEYLKTQDLLACYQVKFESIENSRLIMNLNDLNYRVTINKIWYLLI